MADAVRAGIADKSGSISTAIKKGIKCGGYHWKYADESRNPPPKVKTSKKGRAVRCVDTGEEFVSCREAGRKVSRTMEAIAASIRRNAKCAGFTFEYVS
jgi:hypothetical protein